MVVFIGGSIDSVNHDGGLLSVVGNQRMDLCKVFVRHILRSKYTIIRL